MTYPILDVCCGSRMFWFNHNNPSAIFCDNRYESHLLKDASSKGGFRPLEIKPMVVSDFTAIPFPSNTFSLVVYDPPHLKNAGDKGWQAKKYGRLSGDWREMLSRGFDECFRVLSHQGTLIFKWNEDQIAVSEITRLAPVSPLFGQRNGRSSKTHWLTFMKLS